MVRVLLVCFALVSVASAQNAQNNTRIFGGLGNLAGNLVGGALGAVGGALGGAQQGFGQQGFGQQGFHQQGFHQRTPHQQGFNQGFNPGLQQGFGGQGFPGHGGFGVGVGRIGVGDGASGSSSCRRWCRTPQGQAYCCEGANEPAAVTKQGQCPPVRPSCPPIRLSTTPRQCSSDGGCGGFDKCCFDPCQQYHICKPPIGFAGQGLSGQGRPLQGLSEQGRPVHGPPEQGRPVQGPPEQGRPVQGPPEQGGPEQGGPEQGRPVQDRPEQGHPGQVIGGFPDTISFDDYISKYGLVFENEAERKRRHDIFLDNLIEIQDHNRLYDAGKSSYRMGQNQFSHLTYEEFISKYTGYNEFDADLEQIPLYHPINPSNVPKSLNWVNDLLQDFPIRNQGTCGSCWAFAVACVIESQIKKERRVLQTLSEQYLVDCDLGNHGCEGGSRPKAITYVIDNGIALASGYKYTSGETSETGTCNTAAPKTKYTVSSQQRIESGSDADLLNANIHIGPIAVGIYISKKFKNVKGDGVFVDDDCTSDKRPNHAVVLVGYGTKNGQDYWLLRNSYGTDWGDNGYFKLSRSETNYCKISYSAVFPILKAPDCPPPWFLIGNQCFHAEERVWRNWSSARDHCRALAPGAGGDLAQPKHLEDLAKYLLPNRPGLAWWWIGGSDIALEGDWKWINGTSIASYEWYHGDPPQPAVIGHDEQDCLFLSLWSGSRGLGALYSNKCEAKSTFVCERH